jgi:hypothetical protein
MKTKLAHLYRSLKTLYYENSMKHKQLVTHVSCHKSTTNNATHQVQCTLQSLY